MYTVEIIDSLKKFDELKPEWDRLYSLREHSIFFSFDYVKNYFQIILEKFKNVSISIFIIKDASGKIIAIFPFTLVNTRFCFFLNVKILYQEDFSLLPFYRFLIDPSVVVKNISEVLIEYLKQNQFWDILRWYNIPVDETCFEHFYEEFSKNFIVEKAVTETLIIEVNKKYDEYLRANIKKKDVKEFQRQHRRLTELGAIKLVVFNTRESIEHELPRFYEIENKNWKGRMGTSLLKTYQGLFFKRLIHLPSWDQKVNLFFLQVGKEYIAGLYAVIDQATFYLLKAGYDEKYYKYSPSTVLMYLVFERLFHEEIIKHIDCIGDFYSYERQFGVTARKKYTCFIYRKRQFAQIYMLLHNKINPFFIKYYNRIKNKSVED